MEKKNIKEVEIKSPSKMSDDTDFMNWFNKADSFEQSLEIGRIDFRDKILDEDISEILGDCSNKTCVEIGFGGGRLLNVACEQFGKVIGIDIHESFDKTDKILSSQGKSNYSLIHSDDIDDIDDESVDFVYSFIVFQHFESWSVAQRYLDMISRILKKEGVAKIYFGKSSSETFECHPIKKIATGWWSSLLVSEDFLLEMLDDQFDILKIDSFKKSRQIFSSFRKK